MKEEVAALDRALAGISERLESDHPDLYEAVADRVSESTLALSFVEMETDVVSLRLGALLR